MQAISHPRSIYPHLIKLYTLFSVTNLAPSFPPPVADAKLLTHSLTNRKTFWPVFPKLQILQLQWNNFCSIIFFEVVCIHVANFYIYNKTTSLIPVRNVRLLSYTNIEHTMRVDYTTVKKSAATHTHKLLPPCSTTYDFILFIFKLWSFILYYFF